MSTNLMYAALHIQAVESDETCEWRGCLATASYDLVLFEEDSTPYANSKGAYCTPHLLAAVEREL